MHHFLNGSDDFLNGTGQQVCPASSSSRGLAAREMRHSMPPARSFPFFRSMASILSRATRYARCVRRNLPFSSASISFRLPRKSMRPVTVWSRMRSGGCLKKQNILKRNITQSRSCPYRIYLNRSLAFGHQTVLESFQAVGQRGF